MSSERTALEKLISALERRAAAEMPWKMDAQQVRLLAKYVAIITDQNNRANALLDIMLGDQDEEVVEGVPV